MGVRSQRALVKIVISQRDVAGRLAALEVSGVASVPTPCSTDPCDDGNSCCLAKDKQPSVTRGSRSAWSRCWHQSHPSSQLAQSHQKAKCLLANLSTLPKYLQSSQPFWTSPEAHAQPRKTSEWIPVVATTETEHTHVLNGCGSVRHILQRPDSHAQLQRVFRIRHEHPGVIITAHETRVREDLMTLPGESWSWQRHTKEHLLHHCSHFQILRRVIVMVTGALDEGRIGGLERQHAMFCQIYGIVESAATWRGVGRCSDCPTPMLDQTSSGRPTRPQQSSHGTRKRPHWSRQGNSC